MILMGIDVVTLNNMKLPSAFIKKSDNINVIIESPKGTGNKYTFDPETQLFKLSKILPEGMVFPLHFGFIPCTRGEDGDPLDVLLLMDEPSYPGNLIESSVIGIIEAEQTERDGRQMRNDRIIAAAIESQRYREMKLKNLDKYLLDEISNFFINYNAMSNKKFRPLKNSGHKKAVQLIKKSITK